MALNSSNLPSVQRFKFEDYNEAPQWFAQFLESLNLFVNPVYSILNGGVTTQNLTAPRSFVKTIVASATTTFNFTNPLKIAPTAVLIGNVYTFGNSTLHPAVVIQPMWHVSSNVIYIDNVIGLTVGTNYVITLLIF